MKKIAKSLQISIKKNLKTKNFAPFTLVQIPNKQQKGKKH